jgi:hypothetical protein
VWSKPVGDREDKGTRGTRGTRGIRGTRKIRGTRGTRGTRKVLCPNQLLMNTPEDRGKFLGLVKGDY